MGNPFVSILILNRNGGAPLEACLASLEKQDYRPDRFEILLVDNGSTDDSVAFTRERFPSVRIITRRGNLGRVAAVRCALPQARGEYLAFLDPGVRAGPTWLREAIDALARENAAAAASLILDRDDRHIDSAGGIVSWFGHTWPAGRGASPSDFGTKPSPLLFASSAAMLVERGAYDAAGGFDPDYFACGEDLDLGWRLSLLGYRIILAPGSLAYRDSSTDRTSAVAPRVRLEERNALYTIYKCHGEELLSRVLPVAIALTLARALHDSALDTQDFSYDVRPPETTPISRRAVATLMALEDFARHLEGLRRKRETIQSRRRVADDALLPLFGEPLKTHELGPAYQQMASELFAEFELTSLRSHADLPRNASSVTADAMESVPSVSIIIPTLLGPTHLPKCLSSLRKLIYPKDRLQVIVVDNGSKEDPTPAVRQHYPEAKVVRLSENRGFSGGIAAGVREATGEWLAFLNDDTRVDEEWIDEMVATAKRRRTPCVAARILNWTGDRIDFAGGAVSFEAKGFQLGHGSSRIDSWAEECPVLFACGAAMMVRRDLFLETGGFDEAMFAYYEDVAFGWELTIRGHDVWLSPHAVVYHKHQGTAGRWASPLRTRLYERNALRTVFTHLERRNLQRALPAALLLLNQRILLAAGLARGSNGVLARMRSTLAALRSAAMPAAKDPSRAPSSEPEILPADAAAGLFALQDWLASLPEQRSRRREIQQHRRRSDAETLSAFPTCWTRPVGAEPRRPYRRVHEAVVDAFALENVPAATDRGR